LPGELDGRNLGDALIGPENEARISMARQEGQQGRIAADQSRESALQVLRDFILRRHLKFRSSQFIRNMGVGSVMAVINTLISVVSYPIYLHYLGYHRYGLWLVLSVVVSVAQLGSLGIPWALMKLVAEEHGHGDWEGVKTYINCGCSLILTSGSVFLCAVVVARHQILSWFKLSGADGSAVYDMLPYVAALSVIALLFSTFNATLGGLGRMDLTSYNETLSQILSILFSGTLLYLGFDLRAMVMGALAGYIVMQIVSFAEVQRIMPIPLIARTHISSQKVRQLLGTGGWVLSSSIFAGLLLPFTRLILSRYASLEAVTVNDICWTGAMRVRSIFDSAFRPMIPEMSSFHAKRRDGLLERIRLIDRKVILVNFFIALPAIIGLMIVMTPLLHLWLHRSFNPLLPNAFRITLVGAFASLLGSSAYYMLIGLGRARDTAFATVIQFVVNALTLSAIVLWARQITVTQAAVAFGVSTTASTLFLRLRIISVQHSKEVTHNRFHDNNIAFASICDGRPNPQTATISEAPNRKEGRASGRD
jgi:O-antigen/teichoic acid export membrane protein